MHVWRVVEARVPRGDRDLAVEFASRVRDYRGQLGLSQEELASRAGMHRTFVSRVERAETMVSLQTLVRLAEALSQDPCSLVHGLASAR
ncbi:MAG: transcriptional regulator [Ilumatobacteraceae bacterium]|nr:transcriptional regulator [Ilumatobacteraceae bacterium]